MRTAVSLIQDTDWLDEEEWPDPNDFAREMIHKLAPMYLPEMHAAEKDNDLLLDEVFAAMGSNRIELCEQLNDVAMAEIFNMEHFMENRIRYYRYANEDGTITLRPR